MENKELFKELKKWLRKNSATELAEALGYKSASTISHWLNRPPPGIPVRERKRVEQYITKGTRSEN